MDTQKIQIKLSFVWGLQEFVLNEVRSRADFHIARTDIDSLYLDFVEDFSKVASLKSVSRAYLVTQDPEYHLLYVSKHKSIIGDLIELIKNKNPTAFKTFKLSCAGSDSPQARSIARYVNETFGLVEAEEADLKIHVIKLGEVWEIGVQITPRPLSMREYKVRNMSGAIDPTIAFAMNTLCELQTKTSYLNIFSGSATLLIEAGLEYPNAGPLVGFDSDKKYLSLAIQNIKKAGLIGRIRLHEKDIFDTPSLGPDVGLGAGSDLGADLGMFDVITADLPFGMVIGKNQDLEKLYIRFVGYAEKSLTSAGRLVVYTTEHDMLEKILLKSKFKIVRSFELKFLTSVNAYLRPKILVCEVR